MTTDDRSLPGGGIEPPGSTELPPQPHLADRPLWYRLSARAEPLRPFFAWAVDHTAEVKRGMLASALLAGLLALLAVRGSIARRSAER